ncbi:SseB family protein [Acidimangrovimonas sediminis]|uniref:SseB family protein n=1 Tax=Acidimangrovimonas sediminis TaxID=2056283 RepID=UPI0038B9E507
METDPEDGALRLAFYARLADGELFVLLEEGAGEEGGADNLSPRVFPLEDGPVVLAFDAEERLAEFTGAPAPYVALPGRVVVAQLAGQGVGLGVNLGVAPSSTLLPPEALDWLVETLGDAPEATEAKPVAFHAPRGLPEGLLKALDQALARAGGLAQTAYLAHVAYDDGAEGHWLAILGALDGAEEALARAVAEALRFSGAEEGTLDIVFLAPDAPVVGRLARVALRFDLPEPEAPKQRTLQAPGSDPSKPPILR